MRKIYFQNINHQNTKGDFITGAYITINNCNRFSRREFVFINFNKKGKRIVQVLM